MSNKSYQLTGFDWQNPFHAYCFLGPHTRWDETFEYVASKLSIPITNQYRAVDASLVSIEMIKDMGRFTQYRPYRGSRQLVGLNGSGLTREAAHALLKTLEEPSAGTIIVLYTESTESLISTLLSRCQIVRFSAFDSSSHKGQANDFPSIEQCSQWSIVQRFKFVEAYLRDGPKVSPEQLLDFWLRQMYDKGSHKQSPNLVDRLFEAKKQLKAHAQTRLILENVMINF